MVLTPIDLGIRHLQVFLLFLGFGIAYALRVNLSLAIVTMTDKNQNPNVPVYDWKEGTKSIVLSSFFWGYVVAHIPAAQLARVYGGKIVYLVGIFICSILAMLTPICAEIGSWKSVIALRVLQGLCQGGLFPSAHTILSQWAPVDERGVMITLSYAGTEFGTVVMFASGGFLAASQFGWPCIFYVSGCVGIAWSIAFYIWGASKPDDYKSITDAEKIFIELSLGLTQPPKNIPWKEILKSLPFLVMLIAHCAQTWGFWTLLTQIPSYMKYILGLDIKSNALLSALPYFVMMLLSFLFCTLSEMLDRHDVISLTVNRKLFNTIGHWCPMAALIALAVSPEDKTLAITLLTIAVGLNSAIFVGIHVNHIDLSPNFAGVMMGITNTAANMMSVIAPLAVGLIVTDEHNPDLWRIVFYISAGFYFVGNLVFVLFGDTKQQRWNDVERRTGSVQSSYSRIFGYKG